MASLLERLSLPGNNGSVGPVRSRGARAGTSPYNRNQRPPKGDVNATWSHDLYSGPGTDNSLSARITNGPVGVPKMNFASADRALREAHGEKGFSIKGASTRGNVVQVGGLAPGTTAEDVEAIFKRCGPITNSVVTLNQKGDGPTIRVTFKEDKDAHDAVQLFNGQPADGRMLVVKVVGGVNVSLGGRLSGGAVDDDSVDVLMADDGGRGSKMRSDDILAKDSRAHVLVAPPGMDPSHYTQQQSHRGRGRGRGRGRRGGGGGRMDVDA